MSFEELGLAPPLLRAVVAEGYSEPTPIQAASIPHVLADCDVLACAQTGTGKTAAFALPILHRLSAGGAPPRQGRRIRVLVLSPTRELAAQIGDSFRIYGKHTGLRQTVIFGGVGQNPQVRALRQGVDVLVATPGRLNDLMEQGHIDLRSVEMFVLDEADRMLDMGFLPDLKRIIAKLPQQRQTLLFSATMPAEIAKLADNILRDPVQIRIAPVKATTDLIEQSVCFVPKQKKAALLAHLISTRAVGRALVFTRTKRGADRLSKHLNKSGIRAEAMHGDKSQSSRQRSLAAFKSNRPPILVATDVAARGIDVDGVSHVFNYDLPNEPETYVHRIGRTGRAGTTGIAVSFCDHEERAYLKDIERLIRKAIEVDRDHPPTGLGPAPVVPGEPRGRNRRPSQPRRNESTKSARRPQAAGAASGSRRRRSKPRRTQAV